MLNFPFSDPDFYIRKANALEKIRHELHMHEMWGEAAIYYKDFSRTPPSCECLQEDLVIFYLKDRASFIRAERRDGRSYVVDVGNMGGDTRTGGWDIKQDPLVKFEKKL